MRYTRFPNRNFLIIVLIQGGYSSAIVGLSVAEKGKLEYAHCHTPIRKVNKGIVRIEQSVEAKMICDANMASPPYLSAKMEVVLPAGIPVIRMQTLTSVESSGNGFSTSQISTGKNTNRKQVYHSTDLENRDQIGASARIVPITIMESGTVQPLVMSIASSKKFGSEIGATIKIRPTNTAMMQGCRTNFRKASFLLTSVNRVRPAVHMVKRRGI